MSDLPAITVAEEDYNRLSALLEKTDDTTGVAESLEDELSRADLLPLAKVPETVVVMNSVVLFEDQDNGKQHRLQLVYPHQADGSPDRISILAPAGAAMIGLSVGDSIEWPLKGRKPLHLKVVSVTRSE
ncbi:MAG: nucleoside diphosphate kinase regulator [Marinobacter sp.]|uniref:nucleoside diphosphate kinase regulator n=1 Tax=Marinobacter sp. TaxID=50741 RepID=UPI0032998AB7